MKTKAKKTSAKVPEKVPENLPEKVPEKVPEIKEVIKPRKATAKVPTKLARKLAQFYRYQTAANILREGATTAEMEMSKLENEIFEEMAKCDVSIFNCLLRKNIAAGISDGMIFKVSTRSSITRADGKSETDDKWLRTLPGSLVRPKLVLNKQAVEAAMNPDSPNYLSPAEFRKLGIAREDAQSLKVYDEPDEDYLTDLQKLAKVLEEN